MAVEGKIVMGWDHGSPLFLLQIDPCIRDCQAVPQVYRDDDELCILLFARATDTNCDEIAPRIAPRDCTPRLRQFFC